MSKKQTAESERLSSFMSFVRDSKSTVEIAKDVVITCDKETQDLLHQLELGPYKDRQKFTTQLAHVRRQRRNAKDYILVHEDFVELFSTPEGVKVLRSLEQILGQMRKSEQQIKTQRSYRPRVRTDLTINIKEEKSK